MSRNTYSAGKRQREQQKEKKKKEKAERRRHNRERGGGDIPIASVEDIQGGAMVSPEQAVALAVDPNAQVGPGPDEGRGAHSVAVRLFVGGLNWRATDADLRAAFEKIGPVNDAAVVLDRDTGDSRGFGFVTMADRKDATRAVKELSWTELDGRTIVVKPATERKR